MSYSKNKSLNLPEDSTMSLKEFRTKHKKKLENKIRQPKKGSEFSKLIKEADNWFSRRIRLEGSSDIGIAKCVSCTIPSRIVQMDCGHFHSRKWKTVRWVQMNAYAQCKRCNASMGDPMVNDRFKQRIISDHGQKAFDELEIKSRNTWKSSRFNLQVIIEENKEIALQLLKEKGLQKWW